MHWATIITSTGALLGGLAIVLAFVQLGAQREDRLRAQISNIGVWTKAHNAGTSANWPQWQIALFIRNASELPVVVQAARLEIDPSGNKYASSGRNYKRIFQYTDMPASRAIFIPGTIPPGDTWQGKHMWVSKDNFGPDFQPWIGILEVKITDAAGRRWYIRPYLGRPPRRVRWQRGPWRQGTRAYPPDESKE